MRIWLINHYGVPPVYYPLARPTLFARYLGKMGHKVVVFASSAVHNSDVNLIDSGDLYRKETVNGVNYVYIRSIQYEGNGKARAINLLEFAGRLPKVCRHFKKPDVIVSTSFDPFSCYQGIRLARKYNAKAVAEIADLWPETPVAYRMMRADSTVVWALRILEKKIYKEADSIIFTMEGAYDYIVERGWQREVPIEKVYYINNGIDLEEFDKNKKEFQIEDEDLQNSGLIKIVYTGAIRKVNNLGSLLDAAKEINDKRVIFLIWGDGDELDNLKTRIDIEKIPNVKFKGKVDKKYIPFITSKADINIVHGMQSSIMRFGLSMNKIFDYLAAGKPIISSYSSKYNPIIQNCAGLEVKENLAETITQMVQEDRSKLDEYGRNARKAAEQYDFRILTRKLEEIIRQRNDEVN